MSIVYLSLGSNMGDRVLYLKQALVALGDEVEVVKVSSLYETLPWGKADQEIFYNLVAKISTDLAAVDLLSLCQKIEIKLGRKREEKWGPRVIDIDILLYGEDKIDRPDLKIPHPHMLERDFVIIPIAEVNPELEIDGIKISELKKRFSQAQIKKLAPSQNWPWS